MKYKLIQKVEDRILEELTYENEEALEKAFKETQKTIKELKAKGDKVNWVWEKIVETDQEEIERKIEFLKSQGFDVATPEEFAKNKAENERLKQELEAKNAENSTT